MRITGGRGLKLSATQCYLATDVEENLRKLYETNALSISFSGETIPICSQDELRLASVLACAYHNSLVRENIEELPTLVRLAKEIGVDKLHGALMIAFNPKSRRYTRFPLSKFLSRTV